MKSRFPILVVVLFAWMGTAAAASVKIGFVNIATVMEKAPQADAARKALDKEFSVRSSKMLAERDAIVELEKKLQTDGEIMSESKRGKLEREILRRKRDFNRNNDELREDINIRRNEELQRVQRDIISAINKLAEKEKYDLIVREDVLFASSKIDITDKVLNQLKTLYRK